MAEELAPKLAAFADKLPEGYRVAEGGVVEESAKGPPPCTRSSIMLLVMISLLMIQLQSFTRVTLAFVLAPFGLIGVVAAMLPTGTPMGFVAQLGVIALAGIIIRNAVILIAEVDSNVALGQPGAKAIVNAAKHRARPIVLTALAAILGMVPIAPEVFWGPMAYAIIGGLAVATVLTLTLLPSMLGFLVEWEGRKTASVASRIPEPA